MIFLSHSGVGDLELLQNLTKGLLSKNQIKKIYLVEIEYQKIPKPIPNFIEDLNQKRISKSEFLNLLENDTFQYSLIYEIYKDKYY